MKRRDFAAGTLGALAACSARRGPTVRVAVTPLGVVYLPFFLAESLGLFQEEGLRIEIFATTGGSKSMEALVGGSTDVMIGSQSSILQIVAHGRHVKSFVSMGTTRDCALVISPDASSRIRNIHELKGSTVGVTTPGSGSHHDLNFLLAAAGMPLHDVSVTGIGGLASSVAAVEKGKVNAAILYANAVTAYLRRNPVARVLADMRTPEGMKKAMGAERCGSVVACATGEWLKQNPSPARAFVISMKRSMHWITGHRAEEVREKLAEEHRLPDAAADVEAIRLEAAALTGDGIMTQEMALVAQRILAVSIPEAASLDVTQTYTNEFAGAA